MYGKALVAEVREPRADERLLSCNGCNAPNVSAVVTLGSKNLFPPGGSTGSEFRFCGECIRQVRQVFVPPELQSATPHDSPARA